MKSRNMKFVAGRVMAGLIVAGAVVGCEQHKEPDTRVHGQSFRPEGEERATQKFIATQTSAGARTDATLRAYHFDCGDLNSLGQEKLDLMLRDDDACAPLVLYVDVAQDEFSDSRQD